MRSYANNLGMEEETKYLLEYIRKWERENPGGELVFITLPKYDKTERSHALEVAFKMLSDEYFETKQENVVLVSL